MALNNVVIMGRMVATPELRTTQSGTSVTSFAVAVDKGKDQGADFLDCVAWQQAAEMVCKWFPKGKMIAIEGRLQTRTWEDKNGSKHKATEIIVGRVSFCGDKDNGQNTNNGSAGVPVDFGFTPADDDGYLPFDID